MMDWRGWLRRLIEWSGFASPEKMQDEVADTAVAQPQPDASSLARSTTAFSLRLVKVGPDRESVIHLLHEMSEMSLRQIRTLVNSTPVQVLPSIDAHTGRAIQKRLESLGAVCELIGNSPELAELPALNQDAAGKTTHPDNTFFLFGDYDIVLQTAGPHS